jgi:hypothetical protein
MSDFPKRKPYGETFQGVVLQVGDHALLSAAPLPEATVQHTGEMVLRYAVEFLGKPQYSIVPGLIALDYGEVIVGEEAWEFLFHRSNLYPRADVIGYRNDGVDEMIPIKKLDLMQPIVVLAYTDAQATTPLAPIRGVIAPNTDHLPPWLARYGQLYPTIAEWQKNFHE